MISSGRWHRRGIPVVYAADSPALALLETMAHVENARLLSQDYVVIPIRFDVRFLEELGVSTLPTDWNSWPWSSSTQELGVRWFREGRSPVLRVPSAVVPHQSNFLINPEHPDFGELEVGSPEEFPIDVRFWSAR